MTTVPAQLQIGLPKTLWRALRPCLLGLLYRYRVDWADLPRHLRWPKLFGCTAGVRWLDGLGMVHLRTLDWPLATMGQATRFFRFQRGAREFVSVGVPGQVGVLSGMLPGGYSVTINWAPPIGRPSFDFGPTFLLRDTLETCDRYDDAGSSRHKVVRGEPGHLRQIAHRRLATVVLPVGVRGKAD